MTSRAALLTLALLCSAGRARGSGEATAVFAGGCFWGVESVFEHVHGVRAAVSGYADGMIEAVRLRYDPEQVSYRELLEVFFLIAHDPTQRDRQGPDVGPEYRAVVYYGSPEQRQAVMGYLAELEGSHRFSKPIVTEVRPLGPFRVAEPFHQNYAVRHAKDPYIVINDAPKLERLRRAYPGLFQERSALVE
ncbi:MAG TPA: peptide-methionine (S)-S-oxide reductase MsrA [Gemmatimonadales bacterium]|nr:peptide-methionine (S)-S-oxide reductase MsrA [Gemmatimonadales bacterium]